MSVGGMGKIACPGWAGVATQHNPYLTLKVRVDPVMEEFALP